VTVVFFGDGANAQGSFHESLNMAAIMKWPLIYACENNLYAATTHVSMNCPLEDIADRSKAYGMPGERVDGNDLNAVANATGEAVERARQGGGPTLLELKTYRHHPHCMVIPEHRPVKERRKWDAQDPLPRFAEHMVREAIATRGEVEQMEREEKARLEKAIEEMTRAPLPDPAGIEEVLYAD
jgi:pyruvate dehydrogenase E1 component alpha subunit